MTNTAFAHIGLSCQVPEVIEAFYVKYFGFARANVFRPGPEQIIMIKSGEIYLELFQATESSPVPQAKETGPEYPGWRHICFAVEDLEAKLAEMGDDARVTFGPFALDDFVFGMKACWIADPEGNIIELNQGYMDDPDLRDS